MNSVACREASRLFCRSATSNKGPIAACRPFKSHSIPRQQPGRSFHASPNFKVIKPYLLADIGEGITECQVIQWFVKPGARVEQFDPICEVQSDKASVEITSRFDGVIKKLYYEADDMAKVGKPLVDIDIQSEISADDEAVLDGGSEESKREVPEQPEREEQVIELGRNDTKAAVEDLDLSQSTLSTGTEPSLPPEPTKQPGTHTSFATPAVRHMLKQLKFTIEDVEGTGKDGRVLKEDVLRHVEMSKTSTAATAAPTAPLSSPATTQQIEDHIQPLTPVQMGMYKQMTRSLSIPHFLYTDNVDFSALNVLRKKFNLDKEKSGRITPLAFIVKAVSLALSQHPLLNAHLDNTTNPDKPRMLVKAQHDIGIAIDSPSGLLVPVVRNVQSRSIANIALEITRLSDLARAGKLTSADMSGATFTLSNIGSIGGGAVAPVIVSPQVAILGIGKAREVPAFGENGELVRKEECVFSWSADHRVIDGAMAARCAETVRRYLENVESMLVKLH
ncbi:2-oxoacid dehydrogenases acyltransferase-domain-containing protein [Massariosphaeria phaeospora]|uniref:Dihydrolipoamide acetyltransferase component of pyruvate dehydrogenase complex n=1 Tax=Massariosphaeria phaeospora TaxID=100035 RepID=A0A7C8M9U9_9PLEO|nr:2-oxoacid dehydrogenases acyltransferase-domain-containing protein [Massariosphaeria phaeospora]